MHFLRSSVEYAFMNCWYWLSLCADWLTGRAWSSSSFVISVSRDAVKPLASMVKRSRLSPPLLRLFLNIVGKLSRLPLRSIRSLAEVLAVGTPGVHPPFASPMISLSSTFLRSLRAELSTSGAASFVVGAIAVTSSVLLVSDCAALFNESRWRLALI